MSARDNCGSVVYGYGSNCLSLRGWLLFAPVDEEDPAAAWFKINGPLVDYDQIQRSVAEVFMVCTRAEFEVFTGWAGYEPGCQHLP